MERVGYERTVPMRPSSLAFAVLAGLLALGTVAHAWSTQWTPDGFPTWDSAGYLLQAVKLRDDVARFDLWGLGKDLTHPDLHPPLHAFLLGLFLLPVSDTLNASRVYAGLAFVAGLAAIVWAGTRMHRRHGLVLGSAAALLTALGMGSLELVSTPMTEATTLPVQYAVIALMVTFAGRTDPRGRLLVGVGILAATLVRYNLGPMLAAPLYLHHAVRFRRGLRDPAVREQLLDPGVLLWIAPSALTFAGWQLLRPELLENVQKFLENRSSGIPFWSVANLAWVPLTAESAYLRTWMVVAPLFALFVAGLLPGKAQAWRRPEEDEEGLRVVQSVVVVGFALLTAHDFKIERNLGPALPAFYLAALYPLTNLRWSGRALAALPLVALLVGGGALTARQNRTQIPELAGKGDFRSDPVVRDVLAFIDRHSRERDRTWVVGWMFRISPNLIDWWLRDRASPTKLLLDQPSYGAQSRTGVASGWDPAYATYVTDTMFKGEERERTTYITIQTAPGTRYYDEWKAFGNNYAKAFEEQTVVPEVDRLQFADRGLLVRAYRTGAAPSATTTAATSLDLRPEDDAGIALPAAPPVYRDALRGGGQSWLLYPPEVVDRVKVTREDGRIRLRLATAEPKLQLCDQPRPLPSPGAAARAVANLTATGLAGNAWLHFRGMDEADKLQARPGGEPDIAIAGPLQKDGAMTIEADVTPTPTAAKLRACLILDGATGEVALEDYALFAPDAPRLTAGGAAPEEDAAAYDLGPGEVRARETFAAATAWKLVPADPTVKLTQLAGTLRVEVPAPVKALQLCGPTVPWAGPLEAVLHLSTAVEGRVWFHYRPLDGGGVLLKDAQGAGIIRQVGPLQGTAAVERATPLEFPEAARMVRPCLILDGVRGSVELEDLAFVAR